MSENSDPIFVHHRLLTGDGDSVKLEPEYQLDPTTSQTEWCHIDLRHQPALDWLTNHAGVDPMIVQALTMDETRPRAIKNKNGMLLVLRGVNTNPGQDPEDMVAIRVWLESKRIITVRRRKMMSVSDIVDELDQGIGPINAVDLLVDLVSKLANRIGDFVDSIDEQLSTAEEKMEEMAHSEMRTTIADLRRQIAKVRRYLAPQRDALDRLNIIETNAISERERLLLREESDRVSRYLEDLDLARERALVVQEGFLAQIAQQQNNRMYALSIITAVFLPLGFLTGLLGINVGGMPGANSDVAFWLVCGGLTLCALGIYWVFRRLRWL